MNYSNDSFTCIEPAFNWPRDCSWLETGIKTTIGSKENRVSADKEL